MSKYDDIIDEVEIFAAAEKARRHRGAVRIRIAIISALVAMAGIGASTYVWLNAFPPRPVAIRNPIPPPPPAPAPAPLFPKPEIDWPAIVPGANIAWIAVADPSQDLLDLSADAQPVEISFERLSARRGSFSCPTPCNSRFTIVDLQERLQSRRIVLDCITGKDVGFADAMHSDSTSALHPDGRTFLHLEGNQLIVVDIATQQPVGAVDVHGIRWRIRQSTLAGPDKLLFRMAGNDPRNSMQLLAWDWKKHRLLANVVLQGNANHAGCGAISPGGRYLVTIGQSIGADRDAPQQLVAYDLQAGVLAGQLELPPAPRPDIPHAMMHPVMLWRAVAFSPDGRRLAAVRADGVFHLWDWTTGTLLCTSKLGAQWDTQPQFGRQQFEIAVFSENEPVFVGSRLYSCRTGDAVEVPGIVPGQIRPIEAYLAPGFVRVLESEPNGSVTMKTISVKGKAAIGADIELTAVDRNAIPLAPIPIDKRPARPGPLDQPIKNWPKLPPGGSVHALALAPGNPGHALLVRNRIDPYARLNASLQIEFVPLDLNAKSAAASFVLNRPRDPKPPELADKIALAKDGQTIAMIGFYDNRTIEIRNPAGKMLAAWRPHAREAVEQIGTLRDGRLLVRTETELSLWDWTPDAIKGIYRMPCAKAPFALDPAGTAVVFPIDARWRVADARSGMPLTTLESGTSAPPGPLDRVAFSPDGRSIARIAANNKAATLVVWSFENGAILAEMPIAKQPNRPLAWLDDDSIWLGDVIVSASRELPLRWLPDRPQDQHSPTMISGRLAFISREPTTLQNIVWPDDNARATVDLIDKTPPAIAIRPGDTIAVECVLEGVNSTQIQTREDFRNVLMMGLLQRGFVVRKNADRILRCTISSRVEGPPDDLLAEKTIAIQARLAWYVNDTLLHSQEFRTVGPAGPKQLFDPSLAAIRFWLAETNFRTIVSRIAETADPIPTQPLTLQLVE